MRMLGYTMFLISRVSGGYAMRPLILSLLALTCACGAIGPSDVPADVEPMFQHEALGRDKPALMDFAPRSAAFEMTQINGMRSVWMVLSDAEDACTQMQKKRNPASSRRVSLMLVNGAGGEAITGPYQLGQPNAKPVPGQNLATEAAMEIIDAQCAVSRPALGSGEVNLTALTDKSALASIRLALSALSLGSLGTFEQKVTLQHCPGMHRTNAQSRSQWTCP